jgi:hypothetical protein
MPQGRCGHLRRFADVCWSDQSRNRRSLAKPRLLYRLLYRLVDRTVLSQRLIDRLVIPQLRAEWVDDRPLIVPAVCAAYGQIRWCVSDGDCIL